ncbi:hypothetical protein E8E11_002454 [Didymella keratinophila]|nr:hypothetical protein E8E11_002454 [Didymella keratinophila]
MASPMVDGRVEPHRKATYTLDISDEIRREDRSGSGFSSVKYNHKPNLASGTRSTTLKLADNNTYNLSLRDTNDSGDRDMFVFNGSRTAPSKSYVLLFDQTTQKATLERLRDTYTFNLSSKNGADVSSHYGKIYPKKSHKDSVHDKEEGEVDLFGEEAGDAANESTVPDTSNPYDFRHFLNAVKKDRPEDRGYASSPDHRSTAASTANTPVSRPQPAKKRKTASVFANAKPAAKPAKKAAPAINLERRATEHELPKKPQKPSAPANPGAKIKSAEFVQDSSDSDVDAEGEVDSSAPSPHRQSRRSPSPGQRQDDVNSDAEGEENDEGEDVGYGGLEIEVPDARPSAHNSSHLHVNSGARGLRSPSNGPISLASAANSAENTPQRGAAVDEIDFGDLGGDDEEDDEDVERMDIGPPARQDSRKSVSAAGPSGGAAAEVDEDDPLYMEMMEGLAGGDRSEESEEE